MKFRFAAVVHLRAVPRSPILVRGQQPSLPPATPVVSRRLYSPRSEWHTLVSCYALTPTTTPSPYAPCFPAERVRLSDSSQQMRQASGVCVRATNPHKIYPPVFSSYCRNLYRRNWQPSSQSAIASLRCGVLGSSVNAWCCSLRSAQWGRPTGVEVKRRTLSPSARKTQRLQTNETKMSHAQGAYAIDAP